MSVMDRLRDLAGMTRPRIAIMVLLTALVGYTLGQEGPLGALPMVASLAGILAVAASSAVLNQVIERRFDVRMERTRERPVPSGRVSPLQGTVLGVAAGVGGLLLLIWQANPLTTVAAAATLAMYLGIYTPLKRRTEWNTVVGAVPGAMPPVLGWMAASGGVNAEALALFAILFVWQLPHFFSIAWMYRDDYLRGGYRMLTAEDADGRRTARHMIGYCLLLLLSSVLPLVLGMGSAWYLAGALALGALFLGAIFRFRRQRSVPVARQVMFASLLYLPGVFGLLAFSV